MQSSWVVSVARQSHVEGIGQIQNVDEHPDEDDGQHGASLAEHLPVQSLVLHEHQSGQNKTNKTGTSKVCAISKAQKSAKFLNL